MQESLVSILIPAFNAERWLPDALESATGQTWPSKEIIVVDDGSTDGTAEVAERFAARGVRLVRQSNRGPSAAQNRAIAESRGDYIQYLDADDVISPDKIRLQMARLVREPGCVASAEWGRFYDVPENARFVPEGVWRDLEPTQWLIGSWTGGGGMMQPALWLIPRDVVERAGPWDERLTLINDLEYFTRVLLASSGVRFCGGARLYYRSGITGSVSQSRSEHALQSAWLSLDLATRALLARTSSAAARAACADLFQQLAYDAYGDQTEIARRAEARAEELGGSGLVMGGGAVFATLRAAFGWKAAKQIKRAAYQLGYERIVAGRSAHDRGERLRS